MKSNQKLSPDNTKSVFDSFFWLDEAEKQLIRDLRPALNCVHNENGLGLPMELLDPARYLNT